MVFSLFGKKNPPPAQPRSRPAPEPATQTGPATLAPRPSSSAANPPTQAPRPPAPPASPRVSAPAASATDVLESRGRPMERPDLELTMDLTPGKVPKVVVEMRNMPALHPVVEEAAMLYANGHDDATEAVLREALEAEELNKHSLHSDQLWAMLFDFYLTTGQREAFEASALDYVVRFEKSPPSWVTPTARTEAAAGPGAQTITLTGALNTAAAGQFEQMQRIAVRSGRIRVELGKLLNVDNAGCALFLALLGTLERGRVEVALANMEHLAGLIEKKIEVGKPEHREMWLLLLQIYQYQGKAEVFEEMALQYAITFEESPPSWVARKQTVNIMPAPVLPDVFVLEGDVTGGSAAFAGLGSYAAELKEVVIDLSGLRRMDFVSAGMLLNVLTELSGKDKTIILRGANSMVHTLLCILGINAVAKIERRK